MNDLMSNADYVRGQDFAREQIICASMPLRDLLTYEAIWGEPEEFSHGVRDAAHAYQETH